MIDKILDWHEIVGAPCSAVDGDGLICLNTCVYTINNCMRDIQLKKAQDDECHEPRVANIIIIKYG